MMNKLLIILIFQVSCTYSLQTITSTEVENNDRVYVQVQVYKKPKLSSFDSIANCFPRSFMKLKHLVELNVKIEKIYRSEYGIYSLNALLDGRVAKKTYDSLDIYTIYLITDRKSDFYKLNRIYNDRIPIVFETEDRSFICKETYISYCFYRKDEAISELLIPMR